MAERPLLKMPRPERRGPPKGKRIVESIRPAEPARQAARLGPKFQRLEQSLPDPQALAELRDDPTAIVPERALVFEVASNVVDFYRAVRSVPGLEFLGEDEGEAAPDEDFFIPDKEGEPRPDKVVPRRFYFTIPDEVALQQLVSLWKRYQRGEELGEGRAIWKHVFGYLADIRPWGPRDRLTEDAIADWQERLAAQPQEAVRFEVEFWYRDNAARREIAEAAFIAKLEAVDGHIIDRATIDPIRYHAALVEVVPNTIGNLLIHPEVGLAAFDDVMVIRPQSMVSGPVDGDLEDAGPTEEGSVEGDLKPPIAALLDGLPMAQHDRLSNRLNIDDPDDFTARYGTAREQRHGTAMASLIIHGDLNDPNPLPPVQHQLFVRPILYPQQVGFQTSQELMPPDKLGVDLIWRAFLRMYEGEGDEEPTAPTVRVVNLSLGDRKRRFAGLMSPWARLIDHLAWRYGILILVSAGNIPDRIPLDDIAAWADFEAASNEDRQKNMLQAILKHRAGRKLLSPSESINSLTVGAAHDDHIAPNGQGPLAVDPYWSANLPNPSSALGLGFRRAIKPEILMPGGAEQVRSNSNTAPIDVGPVTAPGKYFGVGVACPGVAGETDRKCNMSGTSVATALATHGVLRIVEALDALPNDPAHPVIDPAYQSVVLKSLLVHSARWDNDTADALRPIVNDGGNLHWEHEREEITRFLGFGCPSIARVVDCAESRATLVGWNTIHAHETDRFRVPLPADLEGVAGFRAVSVTIGWITPVTLSHRMYRLAKFEARPGADTGFSLGVGNSKLQPSHNAVGRGTVYHRRWEGEEAANFVDNGYLVLDVVCSPAAGELDEAISYAVAVSIEVGPDITVPIYERIRNRLREIVRVAP